MIGGTGAYTYDIGNGPQNSGLFTNVTQGSYTVVVDDGTCSSSITVSIACPSAITGTVTTTNITCNGLSDGSITVVGSGGSAPLTYDFGSGFSSNGYINWSWSRITKRNI